MKVTEQDGGKLCVQEDKPSEAATNKQTRQEEKAMQLILESIKKSFGEKKVLKDVTFTFEEGKIYGLLGRNGSGKTTLFNCLSDEIEPDEGTAILAHDEANAAALTPDDVGYVFSMPVFPDFLTGYEFMKFFMEVNHNRSDPSITIDDWFDMVSIDQEDRHRLIKGYSHGMKNKLQMLGCLVARPPVILLDEPLTSLDVVVALEIKKLLIAMKPERILIFSTHILQLATDLCDEIIILNDGRLEQVSQSDLHSSDFEEKIVKILRDEEKHD